MMNRASVKRKWLGRGLYLVSLAFLAFGLFCIGWYAWPNPREAVQLTIPAGVLPGAPTGTDYASFADYELSLTWPGWLRTGEQGEIRVYLREPEANYSIELDQPLQIVMVEPSLAQMTLEPPGMRQVSIQPGQAVDLSWRVSGETTGEFPGQVILSFGFYNEALVELISVPVAVMDISIEVLGLFGLRPQMVLWFGILGLVFWGVFFILGRVVQG